MSQIIFGILLLVSFSIFIWTLNRFTRFMLKGRAFDGELTQLGARVGDVIVYFLGQRSVTREPASMHHALIFWGFLVISVGTLELMIAGLVSGFTYASLPFVPAVLAHGFRAVLDVTNAVVLLIMCYSYFRRLVLKPRLIPMSGDAALILGMIAMLCVTHFLHNAYHVHGAQIGAPAYMPVSHMVTGMLGLTAESSAAALASAKMISTVNYWIHMVIVLFFLNYIPYSKHVHLLGALPNIFFRNRGPKGVLPRRDLEDETQWGVGYYERFDWKSLLDTYACTECARCSNNCPANLTDKTLSPMQLIHDIRDEMRERGDKLIQLSPGVDPTFEEDLDEDEIKAKQELTRLLDELSPDGDKTPLETLKKLSEQLEELELEAPEGLEEAIDAIEDPDEDDPKEPQVAYAEALAAARRETRGAVQPNEADKKIVEELSRCHEDKPLVGGRITEEVLWACVTCGACESVCPVFIEHPQKIVEMRSHLVQAAESMPSEAMRFFRGIENNQNPWGIGSDQRMDWCEGVDVPLIEDNPDAEYLLWIGCAGSFDDRAKKISLAWVKILQQAGVSFAYLGLEEGCTGDAARRAGNEFLFQTMAEANVELFSGYGVKKILTTCPHCYHSFKNEYPRFGGEYEVWHHAQFIRKLADEGKLQISKDVDEVMTYHDSCYLGRWNEIYSPPRELLTACSSKGAPVEMSHTGYKSFCCGAGGGRMWMEEEAPRINERRTEQALETEAKIIATACPFCNVMITDGVKAKDKDEEVQVLDVAELVLKCLPEQGEADHEPDEEQAEE